MKIKEYTVKDIQIVYRRHAFYPNSVVYREKNNFEWKAVPMDSGKWYIKEWIFAFIEII